ncbi:Solute carrier organic anion transporter family member 1A2 [Tupaia chinensis]|uniref:Solute carrier organic anion transporter family member 1A2 n=1 Tax=Tupaia chinensis TaxID=246437 RepID=L9KDK7_TUPCH|nr:Solute carrier organic anion transporter family member 1A2 [Tupaia chinensis]
MPLGISYIEDFSKPENSPLYIGFIETGAIVGPLIGLLLASFCANVYVDTGSVNTGIYNLPPICIGYIAGGLIMKKFKITVKQAAHVGCWLSLLEYLLYFLSFLIICDNSSVAGITTSYEGYIYLGLPAALRGISYLPAFLILILLRKHRLPGENASSGTELVETKTAKKENDCKDTHQNSKVMNDGELKTKL